MFRKINAVFRPNQEHKCRDGRKSDTYQSECTVKLVRSTSLLTLGESQQSATRSTLKRCKSSVTIKSDTPLYHDHRQEDQIWLHSQKLDCLQYLEDLVALRRQYTNCVNNLKSKEKKATVTSKKKPTPPTPPTKEIQTSRGSYEGVSPVPSEEETLQFFDSVIASYDPRPTHTFYLDDGSDDVDSIVATSSSEHDIHSNWTLRDPRRFMVDEAKLSKPDHHHKTKKSSLSGTTSSFRQLRRNPIHLPKVVESAFHSLSLKRHSKKKE